MSLLDRLKRVSGFGSESPKTDPRTPISPRTNVWQEVRRAEAIQAAGCLLLGGTCFGPWKANRGRSCVGTALQAQQKESWLYSGGCWPPCCALTRVALSAVCRCLTPSELASRCSALGQDMVERGTKMLCCSGWAPAIHGLGARSFCAADV